MYLYIELWKARPAWLALSQGERATYMAQLGPGIEGLLQAGIEIVGWAVSDADTPYRADYQYLAAWKMPDRSAVQLLEQTVAQAGWYGYFEQVNARGELVSPGVVIGDMVSLV